MGRLTAVSIMNTKTQSTIENLYRVPEDGKAELVNGELVLMAATGFIPLLSL